MQLELCQIGVDLEHIYNFAEFSILSIYWHSPCVFLFSKSDLYQDSNHILSPHYFADF